MLAVLDVDAPKLGVAIVVRAPIDTARIGTALTGDSVNGSDRFSCGLAGFFSAFLTAFGGFAVFFVTFTP